MSEMLSTKVPVTVTMTVIQDRFLNLKDQFKKNTQFKNLGQKLLHNKSKILAIKAVNIICLF